MRIAQTAPDRVVFWSGAGVSMNPPTSLPSGTELTETALKVLYPSDVIDNVRFLYEAFERVPPLPRLETVLGVASADDAIGLDALRILLPMRDARPNKLHTWLATHLGMGGSHITTNFDTCIERADTFPLREARLVHVHGNIDDLESVRRGASVAALDRGLVDDVKDQLLAILDRARVIVFIGYGGLDYFDVDPFFRTWSLERGPRGKAVVWITHQPRRSTPHVRNVSRRQLEYFAKGGAETVDVAMSTGALLDALSDHWGIVMPTLRESPVEATSEGLSFRDRDRDLAALGLYQHIGATGLIDQTLKSVALPEIQRHGIRAENCWALGKYANARKHYRRALPGPDPEIALRRRERIAATHWVQGRLMLAAVLLTIAAYRATLSGADPSPAAETLINVIRHLKRSPETKGLPWQRLKPWAKRLLPAPDSKLGTHLEVRYRVIRAASADHDEGSSVSAYGEAIEAFAQYEALHGVLNYEHAELRRRIRKGDYPLPNEYVDLHRRAIALGRVESACKVMFLPGAYRAFRSVDIVAATFKLQTTMWQRLRFLVQSQIGRKELSEPFLRRTTLT